MGFAVAAVAEEGCAFGCVIWGGIRPSVREGPIAAGDPVARKRGVCQGPHHHDSRRHEPGAGAERPRRRLKVFESQYNR